MSSGAIAVNAISSKPMLTRRLVQTTPRAIRCFCSSGKPADLPNVQRLAELAQIEVTEAEAQDWAPKIAEVIEWFGKLKAFDCEGIEQEPRQEIDETNTLRSDVSKVFENRADLISEVPQMEGPYVKVPKVM